MTRRFTLYAYKEIELTPKAEEDLEAIWDFSFRQIGVVQADA